MIVLRCDVCLSREATGGTRAVEGAPGERFAATLLPDGWQLELDDDGGYCLRCPQCASQSASAVFTPETDFEKRIVAVAIGQPERAEDGAVVFDFDYCGTDLADTADAAQIEAMVGTAATFCGMPVEVLAARRVNTFEDWASRASWAPSQWIVRGHRRAPIRLRVRYREETTG